MEINTASKNLEDAGINTQMDDLMRMIDEVSYIEARLHMIESAMQDLKDMKNDETSILNEHSEVALSNAISKCYEANRAVQDIVFSINDDMQERLNSVSTTPIKHKYNRVLVDSSLINQENENQYLLEFPAAIMHHDNERYIWVPKKFCTKRGDSLQIRYYDDFKFKKLSFDHNGLPKSSTTINKDQFESLCMSANFFTYNYQGGKDYGLPQMVKENRAKYGLNVSSKKNDKGQSI